jgi:hypothetical protein
MIKKSIHIEGMSDTGKAINAYLRTLRCTVRSNCYNRVTTTVNHPIKGTMKACVECRDWIKDLEKENRYYR